MTGGYVGSNAVTILAVMEERCQMTNKIIQ
jgi:hypothetical protein